MSKSEDSSIDFSGSLTVVNIHDAHAALVEVMERETAIVVNLDAVTEADLTLAQLLEAARRTATARGQAIRLRGPAEGAVLQVLQRGGFLNPDDTDRVDFWLGGKTEQ